MCRRLVASGLVYLKLPIAYSPGLQRQLGNVVLHCDASNQFKAGIKAGKRPSSSSLCQGKVPCGLCAAWLVRSQVMRTPGQVSLLCSFMPRVLLWCCRLGAPSTSLPPWVNSPCWILLLPYSHTHCRSNHFIRPPASRPCQQQHLPSD